jgi:hypothetical protein
MTAEFWDEAKKRAAALVTAISEIAIANPTDFNSWAQHQVANALLAAFGEGVGAAHAAKKEEPMSSATVSVSEKAYEAATREVVDISQRMVPERLPPRDNYKGEAEELVGWLLRELEMMVSAADAERMVAHVRVDLRNAESTGIEIGKRAAQAEWGEAIEEEDCGRAFRIVDAIFGDKLISGDRMALQKRLEAEFAELRAVVWRDVAPRAYDLRWKDNGSTKFDEELEAHRATLEKCRLASDGPWDRAVLDAVWFLLAVAHQP